MTVADYLTELKDTLNKVNRQSYTEIKMIENKNVDEPTKEIGNMEDKTLTRAKVALTMINEILVDL